MLQAVDRPWGRYFIIYADKTQWLKRLIIYPGQSTSLQYHMGRDEHWLTEDEGLRFYFGEGEYAWIPVHPNKVEIVKAGQRHRLTNTTEHDIIVHEWATGRVDEEDIVRVADNYGRAK